MITIDELTIRAPGLSLEEASLLGKRVAEELGKKLPAARTSGYLQKMDLKVEGHENMGRLIDLIVQKLLREF